MACLGTVVGCAVGLFRVLPRQILRYVTVPCTFYLVSFVSPAQWASPQLNGPV